MAGNYMDAPATRLAYDRDGSIGAFFTNTGVMDQLTASELRTLNSEAETGVTANAQNRVALVFPAPVDLAAVFFACGTSEVWTFEVSKDTTTGLDGSWVQHGSGLNLLQDVKPNYRTLSRLIFSTPGGPSQDVRGIRLTNASTQLTTAIRAIHVYADIASSSTLDRLAFWHPTLDMEVPPDYFDWGNVPRGSSADRSFRIKNMSGDLSATDIDVFVEALTPGSPTIAGMHTLSANGGGTFLSSLNLAELTPGEISDVLIVRRTVPTNAQVSVWSARIAADVGAWAS